jgi:hypothetical protein
LLIDSLTNSKRKRKKLNEEDVVNQPSLSSLSSSSNDNNDTNNRRLSDRIKQRTPTKSAEKGESQEGLTIHLPSQNNINDNVKRRRSVGAVDSPAAVGGTAATPNKGKRRSSKGGNNNKSAASSSSSAASTAFSSSFLSSLLHTPSQQQFQAILSSLAFSPKGLQFMIDNEPNIRTGLTPYLVDESLFLSTLVASSVKKEGRSNYDREVGDGEGEEGGGGEEREDVDLGELVSREKRRRTNEMNQPSTLRKWMGMIDRNEKEEESEVKGEEEGLEQKGHREIAMQGMKEGDRECLSSPIRLSSSIHDSLSLLADSCIASAEKDHHLLSLLQSGRKTEEKKNGRNNSHSNNMIGNDKTNRSVKRLLFDNIKEEEEEEKETNVNGSNDENEQIKGNKVSVFSLFHSYVLTFFLFLSLLFFRRVFRYLVPLNRLNPRLLICYCNYNRTGYKF